MRLHTPACASSSLADFLKMEAIRSTETSVNKTSTRRHILEDDILHNWNRLLQDSAILFWTFAKDDTLNLLKVIMETEMENSNNMQEACA
jgi:hypothetical protein